MGLNVGGSNDSRDWPKMGPSLLIATALILAIRTAKWPPHSADANRGHEIEEEIGFSAHLAKRVLSHLVSRHESLFPNKKVPWYQADEEDSPG